MQHIDACVHPVSTKLNSTLTQRATHVVAVHSYAVIRVIKGDLRYDRDCRHYSDRQREIEIIQVILCLWADQARYSQIQGASKGSPACTFYFISIIVNYFVDKCILLTENVSLLELCRFPKIRNCESRFFLTFSKKRNCELKIGSFFDSQISSFAQNSESISG